MLEILFTGVLSVVESTIKRFYVQNVDTWKSLLSKSGFSDRKLEVTVVERGIILPARKKELGYAGGVCDKDFNFVAGYTRSNPEKTTGCGWIHTD